MHVRTRTHSHTKCFGLSYPVLKPNMGGDIKGFREKLNISINFIYYQVGSSSKQGQQKGLNFSQLLKIIIGFQHLELDFPQKMQVNNPPAHAPVCSV